MGATVHALLSTGKGLLAADESFPTIAKRFNALGIESTEENRRAYREMLFTAPGLGQYISGTILFDETIRQKATDATSMPDLLASQGVVPGIKVDAGTVGLPYFPGERITEGLDGLRGRLSEYRKLGARFTKWRAVIAIGDDLPSRTCIRANCRVLAHFAAMSQEEGLVPIIEPEVLSNGPHPLARSEEVQSALLQEVFDALAQHRVILELLLLKTNMILPGSESPEQPNASTIAESTVRCLRRRVPAAVPGILFLSGGQSEELATGRLAAICQAPATPWKLTFSFARALQTPALTRWKGSPGNVPAAQENFLHRARCNSAAVLGKYSARMESSPP